MPYDALVYISVGGAQRAYGRVDETAGIDFGSLGVAQILNETPDTCRFTARGFTPTVGQAVIVALGASTNPDKLFVGRILHIDQTYVGTLPNLAHECACVDQTWGLTRRLVTGYYTGTATAIMAALIAAYAAADGYTDTYVAAAMPTVTGGITFTNETVAACFTRLMARVGGYWYTDGYNIHAFLSETGSDPADLTTVHPSAEDFVVSYDLGQVVTRVIVEGGGGATEGPIAAGATIIPVTESEWYNAAGGTVVMGPQRVTYTGLNAGGSVSAVTGADLTASAPSSAEPSTKVTGALTGSRAYKVAYGTASGVGAASSAGSADTVSGLVGHSIGPSTVTPADSGGSIDVGTHYWATTVVTERGETATSEVGGNHNFTALGSITWVTSTFRTIDARALRVNIYRSLAGTSSPLYLAGTMDESSTWVDTVSDADLANQQTFPTGNTAEGGALTVTIPTSGDGRVTRRLIYRTKASGSGYFFLAEVGDNTTTTFLDDQPDTALGVAAPAASTISVPAGSTSLVLADGTGFPSAGWAIAGGQPLRYTGKTGSNTLTGIPASGDGAILADLPAAAVVVEPAQLTGVPATGAGRVLYAVLKGQAVNLVVIVNDTAAQTAIAALLADSSDGVIEIPLQDGRISEAEATALGTATLALRSAVTTSIRYTSQDPNTRAGRTVTVSLGAPTSVTASFTIQSVGISGFTANPALWPTYTVEASSSRFSFDDLLRLARG